MASTQSSDDSPSEDALPYVQHGRGNSTPRTPLSPQDNSLKVRFQDIKNPSEDGIQSSAATVLSSAAFASSHDEEDHTEKKVSQPHAELLDRINSLENQIHDLELTRQPMSSEKGDDSSERTGLNTEIQWMSWQEYLEDASKASHVLEVLIEKPHSNSRRKLSVAPPATEVLSKTSTKPPSGPSKNIERIRIRSAHLINALQIITEQTFSSSSRLIIHRPFKVLLFYHEQIAEYLVELEHAFNQNTQCHLGRRCKGYIDSEDDILSPQSSYPRSSTRRESYDKSPNRQPGDTLSMRLGDNECKHEVSEELLAQKEAITHLHILTNFMREDMKEIFAKHNLLRSSKAETIAFIDMWHVFMAGDLVIAEDESSGKGLELYQVSILPACDFFSSRRPVKQIQTRTEGSHQLVESVYKEETISAMSVFTVDVFYFDFDGQKFGPVEKRIELISFEGEKKITDLPLCPLRFRKDATEFKRSMLRRGEKFRELSKKTDYPHREYSGLSVGEPQEQIDSQVIIDFALAYRKHPKNAPKFGLRSWIEDDARIVDRFMFDDHRVDRQRTVEFIRAHGSLLRTISSNEELTENMMLLLPNKVYGFVLRSRRWHFLNIDSLRTLERHSDGFESLILPPGVARLVESLVKTHDPQNMPSFSSSKCEREHQVDLVGGKGKGLIILLHGAPGVGKTSTAECVADYTHRPLFPITCGDIGETAKEVEQNLEQNFSLAHRWGCVLLLDEADVFLQARDRENMRRNSVVSVFLRVLEYYSGILFLTTNKVGHFDEAFKSRIHVSLYYPALDKRSTLKIWKMNLERSMKGKKELDVEAKEIYEYARNHYKELSKNKRPTWNGRQIKNAFQTAIALAEFDANKSQGKPVLALEHFKVVAQASEDFDDYLIRVHGGTDADRARLHGQRDDDPRDSRSQSMFFPAASSKSKKYESSDSSSSESSDANEKKRRKKEKKQRKKEGKSSKFETKAKVMDFTSDSSSSESD